MAGERQPGSRSILAVPLCLFTAGVAACLGPLRHSAVAFGVGIGLTQILLAGCGVVFTDLARRRLGPEAPRTRQWQLAMGYFWLQIGLGISFCTVFIGLGSDNLGPLVVALSRPLMVIALLSAVMSLVLRRLGRRAGLKLAGDFVAIAGGIGMGIWFLLVEPLVSGSRTTNTFDQTTAGGYVFADLILLAAVGLMLLRGVITASAPVLAWLGVGFLGQLASDVVILVWLARGQLIEPDSPVAIGALVPLLFMTIGTAEHSRRAGTLGAGRIERTLDVAVDRHVWPAYLVLFFGEALLVFAALRFEPMPWLGLIVGAIVMSLGVAGRQVATQRENRDLMMTDALTGLANRIKLRTSLELAVERCRRTGVPIAVFVLDLDGFKQINDMYGHDAGDACLVTLAELLSRNLRASDTAARLGGDEFAVVLNGINNAQDAVMIAERILEDAKRPVTTGGMASRGNGTPIRMSIGIAVGDPTSGDDYCNGHELLSRADLAMYAAKRRRTSGWQLFCESSMLAHRDDARLREDLRLAVAEGRLGLVYQPVVDLASGTLVGVEALARWEHPERGEIQPGVFIPLAEESDLIDEIGAWVLDRACQQVVEWQRKMPDGRYLRLGVNCSAGSLERGDVSAQVRQVLQRTGLRAADLVLEVTETSVVTESAAVAQLTALREQGVRIALDDFGTGYSSLRYLTRLPVDILKLDRCFVAELNGTPEGSALAEAVIRLAQILHLDTVAEGVETEAQVRELTLLGFQKAQGYHFSRPLSGGVVSELIDGAGHDGWPTLPNTAVLVPQN